MRQLFIVIAILNASFGCYSQHLPILKNGKWGVIDTNGNELIKPSYQKADPFYNGYAVVAKNEKYGLIDTKNQIKIPFKYFFLQRIIENKYIVYQNSKYGLINDQDEELLDIKYDYIYPLSDSQLVVEQHNKVGLFDSILQIPVEYDSIRFHPYLGKIGAYIDARIDFYNLNYPKSFSCETIESEFRKVVLTNVILSNGDTLDKMSHLFGDNYKYAVNDSLGIINFTNQSKMINAEFDHIEYDKNWLYLHKADSVYISDLEGNVLVRLKADNVYKEENGIWLRSEGKVGYLLNNGNLIPVKFGDIYSDGDFFLTWNGSYGLYYKNGKRVLSSKYDNIIISDNKLKAYEGSKLRTLEVNSTGKIIQDKTYNNALRVNIRNSVNATWRPSPFSSRANGKINIDYKYGWFQAEKLDSNNNTVYGKLGIELNDSSKLRPQYNRIVYWDSLGFTQALRGYRELKKEKFRVSYQAHDYIAFNSHKKSNKGNIMYSNPLFWKHYVFQDVIVNDQLYYMSADLQLSEKMGYIDKYYDGVSVFQTFGKGPTEKCDRHSCIYYARLNTTRVFNRPKNISFEKGEWGIMTEKGDIKFQGQFSKIERFKKGTGLVMKNGSYGLINKDSLLIPTKYKSLDRISELGDSMFYASKGKYQQYFTDSILKPYPFKYHSLIRRINDKMWIKKTNRENGILSSNLDFTLIKGFIKKNFDEILLVKQRGLFGLFDLDGNEVVDVNFDEIQERKEGFVPRKRRTYGFVDLNGNEVLPTEYQEIGQAVKGLVTAKKESFYGLYTTEGKIVLEHKYKFIHINPLTGRIFVTKKNGQVFEYDQTEEKFESIKIDDEFLVIKGSYENYLIYEMKKRLGLYDPVANKVITAPEFDSFDTLSTEMIKLIKGKKFKVLFKNNHEISDKFYQASIKSFDSIFAFRRGINYSFYSNEGIFKKELVLYQAEASNSGLMLVRSAKGLYFMNAHFQNEFNDYYQGANSYYGGYACINKGSGWQIINRNGFKKTHPSYGQLRPIFNNVFEVKSYSFKGVFDSNGKEIVPVKYLNIKLINRKYFQAVTDGEIHYYDLNGTQIY